MRSPCLHPTGAVTWLVVVVIVLIAELAQASSQRLLPLKRVAYVSNVQLERLERDGSHQSTRRSSPRVSHSDSLRLSFRAFDNDFHLHLEPTENLVALEGATIRYTAFDEDLGIDVVQREELLLPQDVRAYQGVVMHDDYSARRLVEDRVGLRRDIQSSVTDAGVMGRAAILLHDDGADSGHATFEGTFEWAGNQHTIQLPSNYDTSRSSSDPPLSRRALRSAGAMVLHRRSDRMSNEEAKKRGLSVADDNAAQRSSCQADSYEYNAQNALRFTESDEGSAVRTMSPLSFFAAPSLPARLGRRTHLWPSLRHDDDLHRRAFIDERSASVFDMATESLYSYRHAFLAKRQGDVLGGSNNDSFIGEIGSTSGCPSSNRVVYMGIATDCTYSGRYANSSAVRISVLNDMNTVSNIYRSTFRVSLGVVQMEIREAANCPSSGQGNSRWNQVCSDGYTLDQRLSDFSSWRGNQPANGTGLWHLLTTCQSGSEVGVAWLGTLCKTDGSGQGSNVVSGTGVTASTENAALTMAHEIGHNFGAVHDCVQGCSISGNAARQGGGGGAICCPRTSSSCNSNAAYIMSPYSTGMTAAQSFSPCSIGNICSMLGRGLDTSCVADPAENPRATLSTQQCGNGILEPGEECDAGPSGSQCCTSDCRLTSGSVCDPEGTACCTSQCQFASTSTVCRPAVDDRCDTAETCSGTSAECPADARKADGASCGSGLQCATGHCTSRDLQCQQQSQADYNFTRACSVTADNSCSVSCVDPTRTNACAVLQQNFIDGTECGYGRCEAGVCKAGSWQNTVASWYRNNLQISIPVTIVVGLAILALLYGLLRCLCLPMFARATGRKVPGQAGPAAIRPASAGRSRRGDGRARPSSGPSYTRNAPPVSGEGLGGGAPYSYSQDTSYTPPPPPARRAEGGAWVDPYSYNGPVGSSYPTHR